MISWWKSLNSTPGFFCILNQLAGRIPGTSRALKTAFLNSSQKIMMEAKQFSMTYPAVLSHQGGFAFYSFAVPFDHVSTLFDLQNDLPEELKAQRKLKKSRVKRIAKYIEDNNKSFVFPAITAAINDSPCFEQNGNVSIGLLNIPSKITVHDGQHRVAGIIEFLENYKLKAKHPRLNKHYLSKTDSYHYLPVILLYDSGLSRSQQIFCDINRNAVKPKKELIKTFDHRTRQDDKLSMIKQNLDKWFDQEYVVRFVKNYSSYTLVKDFGQYLLYKGYYADNYLDCEYPKIDYRTHDLDIFLDDWGLQDYFKQSTSKELIAYDPDFTKGIFTLQPDFQESV